ncbi:MAG: hypothetical protein NUV65_00825, partial [Candidatus Roizmanbacteria bacterium]|nr:hypothetical protein [Candidatus Roizmanbacteria bacterium]
PKTTILEEEGLIEGIKTKANKPRNLGPGAMSDDELALRDTLASVKGLSADDIMAKHPDIQLKRDVPVKDIHGNKAEIPEGEVLTPYELKGGKVLLQDGETYIVSKNQFANIKGQSASSEAKAFAPELEGLEESVRGSSKWKGDELIDNGNRLADVYEQNGKWYYRSDMMEESSAFKTRKEAIENAEADALGLYSGNETKYSQYQLPDGENYKEILIKAPETSKAEIRKVNDFYQAYVDGKPIGTLFDTKKQALDSLDFSKGQAGITFKSSHWDEPNVISHLRLNERTYKGKRVTFMEEAQSDWAREYRKHLDIAKEEGLELTDDVIPSHPLVQGNKWQELSVKRALKESVDNNSEYFAWINGEQTSARYNLATHLDDVSWNTQNLNNPALKGDARAIKLTAKQGEKIDILIDKEGVIKNVSNAKANWKGKKLDEVLGKGLADSIMAKESGTLSGEGLKFGGEWANNLYDRQIKNIVEDVTGGKVEVLDMGLPIEKVTETFDISTRTTTQQGIKLTPEIKAKIRGESIKLKK